jgi:hypothetical protein
VRRQQGGAHGPCGLGGHTGWCADLSPGATLPRLSASAPRRTAPPRAVVAAASCSLGACVLRRGTAPLLPLPPPLPLPSFTSATSRLCACLSVHRAPCASHPAADSATQRRSQRVHRSTACLSAVGGKYAVWQRIRRGARRSDAPRVVPAALHPRRRPPPSLSWQCQWHAPQIRLIELHSAPHQSRQWLRTATMVKAKLNAVQETQLKNLKAIATEQWHAMPMEEVTRCVHGTTRGRGRGWMAFAKARARATPTTSQSTAPRAARDR